MQPRKKEEKAIP